MLQKLRQERWKPCRKIPSWPSSIQVSLDQSSLLTIMQRFLLSEAISVHLLEHNNRINKVCGRRLADEVGIDEDSLSDEAIELSILKEVGHC